MKTCFITTSFAEHKQERLSYAERYLPKGVDIFLLTIKSQNKYTLKRTKIIELPENKIKFTLAVRKFCRKNNINIIANLGTPSENYASLFSSLLTDTKYIINEHGNILDFPLLYHTFFGRLKGYIKQFFWFIPLFLASKIIFGSKDQAEIIRKKIPLLKTKISYLPLIINEKIFSIKDRYKTRAELNLPKYKDIILFVARISLEKGSDILYALAKLNPHKLFIIIGTEIDTVFSSHPLKNVILLGPKSPRLISKYYSASDLSILPSKIEGFGLVSRESMLCGTPALVSDIRCLRTIPNVIIAKNNIRDMQKKIKNFFLMPLRQREVLGRLARQSILNETSYSQLNKKYRSIFLGQFSSA